ncbi:hypothetical protein YDYSY3_38340 [Paenibacillus chitinolyticus]|nr:hypothetical protein YDYSY3_38340 [Paenibacillus chitinolyticus]
MNWTRNTSGTTGVYFESKRNKWSAEIMFQMKKYRLGRYTDKTDAIKARMEAEEKLQGDFLKWYKSRKDIKSVPQQSQPQKKRKMKHSDDELLQHLRDVAKQFPDKYLTVWDYVSVRSSPSYQTITTRFGSWAKACERAGVESVPRSDDAEKHRKEYYREYARRKRQELREQAIVTGNCKVCGGEWIPPKLIPGKRKATYCLNCQKRMDGIAKRRKETLKEMAQSIMLIYAMLQFYK